MSFELHKIGLLGTAIFDAELLGTFSTLDQAGAAVRSWRKDHPKWHFRIQQVERNTLYRSWNPGAEQMHAPESSAVHGQSVAPNGTPLADQRANEQTPEGA